MFSASLKKSFPYADTFAGTFGSLLLFGLFLYTKVLFYPFVHDEIVTIQHNPSLQQFNLREIFLHSSISPSANPLINVYYRPLLEVVYGILFLFFGLKPFYFHAANVLLHIINSFLVYVLGRQIEKSQGWAFLVAILFLIHPIQTEAVACISGMSNVLYVFFCLIGLNIFITIQREQKYQWGWMIPVVFLLGLMVKEQTIVLPFLMMGFLFLFPDEHKEKRKLWWIILSPFLILIAYFIVRKYVLGIAWYTSLSWNEEFVLRMKAIGHTLMTYIRLIFWPSDLHYYRTTDILKSGTGAWLLLGLISAALIFVIRKMAGQSKRLVLFGLAWFLIALLPTLNIIPLVAEYSSILAAEHFAYFALIGFLLAMAEIGQYYLSSSRKITLTVIGIIIISCSFITFGQNKVWSSEIALFERTVKYEKLGRVYSLLGRAYYAQGEFNQAAKANEEALSIMYGYYEKVIDKGAKSFYLMFVKGVTLDLARSYEMQREPDRAQGILREAAELDSQDSDFQNMVDDISREIEIKRGRL